MKLSLRPVLLLLSVMLALVLNLQWANPAWADHSFTHQPTTDVYIALGNDADAMQFFPDTLQFQSGHRYNLHVSNPSSHKHCFDAKDFANNVWSQKVEVGNVEIKGTIYEIELNSHTEAEWVFVPLRAGTYSLRCSEAEQEGMGMVGTITIS